MRMRAEKNGMTVETVAANGSWVTRLVFRGELLATFEWDSVEAALLGHCRLVGQYLDELASHAPAPASRGVA